MDNMSKISSNKITHIYDRIFKKILTLSSRAVIGLINGSHSYHIEAQMYEDEEIEFRVFDYGYKHALKSRNGINILEFPQPQIIYLYEHENIPDTVKIILDFGSQGIFEYKVPVFKLLEHNLEELNRRKMIILVPFMILKLRRSIEKKRTDENMEALRTLILDDIIELIRENQEVGNITAADARRLHDLIHKLYNHLYSHYDEFIEGGLNDMMEDGLILETDIIEAELTKKITKRVTEEVTEQVTKEVTEQVTKEVSEQLANETAKREKRIQEKAIKKLYLKLGDINEIAECLDIPVEKVKSLLENETVM